MVQFKDVLLGSEKRSYVRATTSQRCVRAGGKHNDLENVGYTARHHTFFEMLGNFSFGDYFKPDAIRYCWDLLTEVYGLPVERLWVTVYEEDQEAEDIWKNEIGVDPERFSRCGVKDNFWSMGDTGPCGPCSEVFYDHGPEVPGGPPGSPDEDGDRYIEIWNLVFMQYNRDADGTMTPLPKPSVDTGMGLERLAAVLQGVHSNYETDLFIHLIEQAAAVTGGTDLADKSLREIADHIRACAFLIVDGVVPSNEGRGYVLRRIIRRAIRHGHKLGVEEPFFYRLVEALEQEMGAAYPELGERREVVERILRQEEERFDETLDQGLRILDQAIEDLSGDQIPGDTVFRLYDTFGFPVDLTADIARERGLTVDMANFEKAMEGQRGRARAASQFEAAGDKELEVEGSSEFVGYDSTRGEGRVIALFHDGAPVDSLGPEDRGIVVMDSTPFYPESGGQVGDHGEISANGTRFEVDDTQRRGDATLHVGVITDGEIRVGDSVVAQVDAPRRRATARNHSATHLLHAALRQVLGGHVAQKGSLVAPDRLRFDFSHFEPVSKAQLEEIEALVNEWILQNDQADTQVLPLAQAMESGAVALFGEKYDDPVRVLAFGEYSTELCGGTHVGRTGDVGLFKLTSETGVAAGVRRVEAVTGQGALRWVRNMENRLLDVASLLKADRESVVEKVDQLQSRNRELEKDLERFKARMAASQGDDLAAQAEDVDGLKVLAAKLDGVDPKRLRDTVDQLKNKLGSAAIVLATVHGDKVSLVAGVTSDYVDRIEAGPLANFVAQQVGGRGGGRADLAQAGGNDPSKIDQAIRSVPNWIKEQLSA
jgi:alanyl-tRNA synthetase